MTDPGHKREVDALAVVGVAGLVCLLGCAPGLFGGSSGSSESEESTEASGEEEPETSDESGARVENDESDEETEQRLQRLRNLRNRIPVEKRRGGQLRDAAQTRKRGRMKWLFTGSLSWRMMLGTLGPDMAADVAVGPDGFLYATGSVGFDIAGKRPEGKRDAFVAKFTSDGKRKWLTLLGTEGHDRGLGIDAAPDGSVYVVGTVPKAIGDGEYAGGDSDGFYAKFDSDGNREWVRMIGTSDVDDTLDAVDVGPESRIYIGGETADWLAPDSSEDKYNERPAYVVMRIRDDGTTEWRHILGKADDKDWKNGDVAVGPDGNPYVTGMAYGRGFADDVREKEATLVKFDASGDRTWTKRFGKTPTNDSASAHERGRALDFDEAGNVYVAGESENGYGEAVAGDDFLDKRDDYLDVFVTKFTSSGDQKWVRQIGSDAGERVFDVDVTGSGTVRVVGSTQKGLHAEGVPLPIEGPPNTGLTGGTEPNAYLAVVAPDGDQKGNMKIFGTKDADACFSVDSGSTKDRTGVFLGGRIGGDWMRLRDAGLADAFLGRIR